MEVKEIMKLADEYADRAFEQGLHRRELDDAPEAARKMLLKAIREAVEARKEGK